MTQEWRQYEEDDYEDAAEVLYALSIEKARSGLGIYGEEFDGDPIQHLREELADAGNYLGVVERERQELYNTLDDYENLIDTLRDENSTLRQQLEAD